MSKLSDLMSKGEKITLSNGLELEIFPMTLREEAEIAEHQKNEDYVKAVSMLVMNAIKKAVPDATDEEINCMNKNDLQKISEKVLEVNGLKTEKNQ